MKTSLVLPVLFLAVASGHHHHKGEDEASPFHAKIKEAVAKPPTKCETVYDDVWEEVCTTKYNNTCRGEMQTNVLLLRSRNAFRKPRRRVLSSLRINVQPFRCQNVRWNGKSTATISPNVPHGIRRFAKTSQKMFASNWRTKCVQ